MPESLLRGIDNVLTEHDMHLSLTRISKNRLTSEDQLPKLVREWASDGLLINYMADAPEIATVRQIIERFDRDISRFKILNGIDEPQAAVAERTALVTP